MRVILVIALMASCAMLATAQTRRSVLMEMFSTERCNNCPLAHSNVERIFGDGGDSIIMLGHHAGFYTDDFSLAESVEYEWFYTPSRGTYAPAAMMDRRSDPDGLPEVYDDGVPVFDGARASRLQAAYAMASALPAYAAISITTTFDTDTRLLSATVSGRRLRQMMGESDLRLNVFLAEDSVFSRTQAGAIGQYYHRHMARQCLTGTWGMPIQLDEGFAQDFTLTLPDDWSVPHLSLIAFVSNYNPADRNNCQVLNTASAPIITSQPHGIEHISNDRPSPATSYNIIGQPIRSDTRGLRIQGGQIILLTE